MRALTAASASAASLLLNLEGVFTALLAWFLFRENFDARVAKETRIALELAKAAGITPQ